jgi:hypothetical protein
VSKAAGVPASARNRYDQVRPGCFGSALPRPRPPANLATCQQPLRRRGLVTISVDEADKRSRRLTLTPAGHALLLAAVPVSEKEHAAIEGLLEDLGPDRLRADLRALY